MRRRKNLRNFPLVDLTTREWCTLLACWRVCSRTQCSRAKACHGDAEICSKRNMMLLPAGAIELWLNAYEYARDHGVDFTYAQARAELNDDVRLDLLDWEDAVACSLGQREPEFTHEPWPPRGT